MRERREERIASRIPWGGCTWFTLYLVVQCLGAAGSALGPGVEGFGGCGCQSEADEVETYMGFCLP